MNPFDLIKKEHEFLITQLQELKFIMTSEIINYPNLIHTFNTLKTFWDEHEKKEEYLFNFLSLKGFKIPIDNIDFEHGKLRKYRENITQAINSGSELKIKDSLNSEGENLLNEIYSHIEKEEWIFTSINWEDITISENERIYLNKLMNLFEPNKI
jgi:hemerythrin-like domain-containing protein